MTQWFFDKVWMPVYGRWALRYTRRLRRYAYAGVRVQVPPGVFHPGLFFSTPFMIDYLETISISGKKVLEMGCGSGLLALFAAKQGAQVTAVDINPQAVDITRQNAFENNLQIEVTVSDLFRKIPPGSFFDIILVNPPYFAAEPGNLAQRAFFAGENLEYFDAFFSHSQAHLAPKGMTLMVLSTDCDLASIAAKAAENGWQTGTVAEKRIWGKQLLIWEVKRLDPGD